MAKSTPKTTETKQDVDDFLDTIADEGKRDDSRQLIRIMKDITGHEPKMWGTGGIIGFGTYHYKYDSGHEGDAPIAGFAPRKDKFSLYLTPTFDKKEELLAKFGKHKAAVGCIYFKKLADVDEEILKKMVANSIAFVKKTYPGS